MPRRHYLGSLYVYLSTFGLPFKALTAFYIGLITKVGIDINLPTFTEQLTKAIISSHLDSID